jgi:hypothetical protein
VARTRVRWGRIGAATVTVALCGALLAGRAVASGTGPSHRVATVRVHVVRPGETLWAIARAMVGPQGDPRPVVDALIRANHLPSLPLQAGARLVLPRG